jgi:hypothetical protein
VSSIKEKLIDIYRQLVFHPVAYCLYKKIEKGRITWKKNNNDYILEDGGMHFVVEYRGGGEYNAWTLRGIDIETEEKVLRVYYNHKGPKAIYNLMCTIDNEPIETAQQQRVAKYLKENC